MTTDSNKYYDQNDNNTEENQSYVDQYQQEHMGDENTFEQEMLLNEDQNYLDSEFSNALERDDQEDLEQNYDDSELNEDDLEEDDLEEDEDDVLRVAPASLALGALGRRGGTGLQTQDVGEADAGQAEPADAKEFAAAETVAGAAWLSGDADHRFWSFSFLTTDGHG